LAKKTKYLAKKLIKFITARKAEDVLLLDLRKVSPIADFFIICTGLSDVQIKAIADSVIEGCKANDLDIYHIEGYESMRWVLIDLVDVVIHIFHPETREYYKLERLWGDAPKESYSYES